MKKLICVECGGNIPRSIIVNDKIILLHERRRCLICWPYKNGNYDGISCEKCGNKFPTTMTIEGKRISLNKRKYCLDCSPFKSYNRRNLTKKRSNTHCLYCSKILINNQTKYCSKKCMVKFAYSKNPKIKGKYCLAVYKIRDENLIKAVEYLGGKCSKCNTSFPLTCYDFHHLRDKKHLISRMLGNKFPSIIFELDKCQLLCANCHGEKHHNNSTKSTHHQTYYIKKKQKAVDYLGGSCSCGYDKCIRSLDFHHVDKNKDIAISKILKRSWENILKELEKCIVICRNCHRIEHKKRDLIYLDNDANKGNRILAF